MSVQAMNLWRWRPSDVIQHWLEEADIRIRGTRPWDLQVHRPRVFPRVLTGGSLAVGESYMDGDWDAQRLDQLLAKALRARIDRQMATLPERWLSLKSWVVNRQSIRRAFDVGARHYDVGDDVYQAMLDPRMIYTCGYWAEAQTLAEAQDAKLDLVARKLRLAPGMRVLDIGCGWGGAAAYFAERHGVEVVGVTVSKNQAIAGRQRSQGLAVDIQYQDYRSLTGSFDRIYSLGMFEHVGVKNYAEYFQIVRRLLARDGLFLLHTIGNRMVRACNDPWIERYIFPNSYIPARSEIAVALEPHFVVEDWHDFGPDYDRTLMAWLDRFDGHWPELAARYDERFRRMWRYWLAVSAASFRVRDLHLWQVLLSRDGVPGGLAEIR